MHSMLVESGYTRGIMEEIGGKRNDTDGHSCSICGKTFPFQSSLSQHMRKHTGEKPYKCPYCPHRAAQKGALKAHIRSHKMGTLSHGFEESDIEMGVSEGLDGCASPTESTSACNDVAEGKKSVSHRCSICRKKLRSRAELQHHVHLLHKPFRCRLCSYEVLREDQLLSHIEKTHITVEASVPEADTDSALLPAQKSMSSFGHICQVCGRRFRETWFLKNHMKTHGSKTSSKGKPRGNLDAVTINEVLQEEVTMGNTLCLFKLCPKCGHLFHNQENLRIHQRVHSHSHLFNGKRPRSQRKQDRDGTLSSKSQFMECLKLMPVATAQLRNQQKLGSRIPELDPICSYQAWQLATKGRVVEATESGKRLGWEDIPADEAYDQERGEYTLVRQYKGKKELDSQNCQGQNSENPIPLQKNNRTGQSSVPKEVEKSPDLSLESQRDLDIETSTLRSRHFSQSTTNECFKCGKMFHTHHQMLLHCLHCNGVFGSRVSPESSKGESAYASCSSSPEYESSTPYSSPGEHVTTKGTEGAQVPTLDLPLLPSVGTEAAPLDLSVQSDAQMFESEDRLLSHRCTRCPYSTYYPEVLWIHQRIAHQAHSGAHAGRAAAKRRTGPPPALGGQESPPFPPTQVPRTAPPVSGGSRNPTNHAKGANATPKPSRVKKRRLQVEAQLQGYTVPGEGLGCVLSQTSSRTTRHKRVAHTPSLKNCNSQQRATRYHQPGSSKGSKLKQTDVFASLTSPPADAAPPARPAAGMPRSPQRQGDYLCRECGKHFSQAAGLQTHARPHTGEWPFHCCYCSYTSSLKGDLKSNVQREPRSAFNTVRHNNKLEHPQLPETSTLAKEPLPSA